MDAPHRAFAVGAALWALVSPWVVSDECFAGRSLGLHCQSVGADFAMIVAVSVLPVALAYVALFLIAPPAFRWVAAGSSQELR
jgi:hypothetical protein